MNRFVPWVRTLALSVPALYASASFATGETRIYTVGCDLDSLTLVMDGVRFANNATPNTGLRPYVEFAGTPVVVLSWSTTSLTAKMPAPPHSSESQIYLERQDFPNQAHHSGMPADGRTDYSLTLASCTP